MVSRLKVDQIRKNALWHAYSRRCAYCRESTSFSELEIDHILPQKLCDDPLELERLKSELSLPPTFGINSTRNLAPAHRRCNGAKSGRIFESGNLRYFLEIAASKEALVDHFAQSITLQNTKDILLASVRVAIESGSLNIIDLPKELSTTPGVDLTAPLRFQDGSVEKRIQQQDIDALLDRPVLISTKETDGLEFAKSERRIRVRTCREYRAAKIGGYEVTCNWATKMETFFGEADAILRAVSQARLAVLSNIRDPFLGVADLYLLPKTMLPYGETHFKQEVTNLSNPSLGDMLLAKLISIKDVSSRSLCFEWNYMGARISELLRADIDGDGIEEIMVRYYTYATQGTLGFGSVGLLKRAEPTGMFQYLSSWP